MKCLITGGAGFIGSNLALELEKQGHNVTIVDNLISGDKKNIESFKGKFIELDISKPFQMEENFDIIFHEAAITDPRFENDNETIRVNIEGFKNILELAKKNNAKIVYASTAGLYGNGYVPMKEDQKKEVLSAYGKSKLIVDKIASEHFDKMYIVGLRYFNVFGPREAHKGRPASMTYHLAKQIKAGKNPRIFKWGEQKRDHIYVKDAVEATIKAIDVKKSGVYNVGTGIATSFNDLIKILNEVFDTSFEPEYFDMPYDPKTYQNNTQADTTKAEKFLGFKAKWSLKKAIKNCMEELKWI